MDRILVICCLMSGLALCQADQAFVDNLAQNLRISYDVVSNLVGDPGVTFGARLTLENLGTEPIPGGVGVQWELYFCHVRLVEPATLLDSEDEGGVLLGDSGLRVSHVTGCLHRISPDTSFAGIGAGASLAVPFRAEYWEISRTDVMPNWYVSISGGGVEPRVVSSTADGDSLDFVGAFDSAEKWKRIPEDTYDPFTAEDRYAMRDDYNDRGGAEYILPTPVDQQLDGQATVDLTSGDWVIISEQDVLREAEFLGDSLGIDVNPPGGSNSNRVIFLDADNVVNRTGYYELQITDDNVTISGSDQIGTFYGVQSMRSLVEGGSGQVPSGSVVDYPRYQYRGMHIDVGRNFHSKEDVLKLLDVMTMYKLNKLHFHLTDDEGWRLEIADLPELTEIGAQRCHDMTGDRCIMPQLGSAPVTPNTGSGYYSIAEYREILTYAERRHIQVIPEFDMPGHAHAAINAMLARYRKLIGTDEAAANEFLLTEIDDPSEYLSVQYFRDNAINPCVNGTYNFVRTVISAVKEMHADIQPLTIFNFGGDEVPEGAWINSSACHDLGLTTREQIKERLIVNIARIVSEEGLDLAGWEDGYQKNATELYGAEHLATANEYSYVWDNVWEWGGAKSAYEFANADYKVILSHATHVYYDHPQEPDPEERGYYWATRVTGARKTFGYMPDSVYDNIDVDRMGNVLDKDAVCADFGCTPLETEKVENIVGIQGHIWCETVRTSDHLWYMVLPRLLALAERAWHKATWEDISDPGQRETERTADWERFANTLGYKELARLDTKGIPYAVSPAGARMSSENKLLVKTEFPGLKVQYSTNQGQSWVDHNAETVMTPGNLLVVTRSADGTRMSRTGQVTVESISSGNRLSVWPAAVLAVALVAKIF